MKVVKVHPAAPARRHLPLQVRVRARARAREAALAAVEAPVGQTATTSNDQRRQPLSVKQKTMVLKLMKATNERLR